jgi:hypothetical protein
MLVDAKGKTAGRLATEVARICQARTTWRTPFMGGRSLRWINARHAIFKGGKATDKMYRRHTLSAAFANYRAGHVRKMSERVIEIAVKGMLPKRSVLQWVLNSGLRGADTATRRNRRRLRSRKTSFTAIFSITALAAERLRQHAFAARIKHDGGAIANSTLFP